MSEASQSRREIVNESTGEVFLFDENDSGEYEVESDRRGVEKFFIASSYRAGQREALQGIESAFQRGFRYVLLEAPTGVGKSHIARAFAFCYAPAVVLTVQKILQDQYNRDFPDMYPMKGRGAYTCIVPERTCAEGLCKVKREASHGKDCPYKKAMQEAKESEVILHNFDSFYYQSLNNDFGRRPMLVVDECHAIESKFLEFMSFSISNYRDPEMQIPCYDTPEEYHEFLHGLMDLLAAEAEALAESERDDKEAIKRLDDITSLRNRIEIYFNSIAEGVEYVFDYKEVKDHVTLDFKPVLVGSFVRQYFVGKAEKVLMVSATILDKEIFCKSIGIPEAEVEFIRLGSSFPIENRPIRIGYAGSMNYADIDKTLPKLCHAIKIIMAHHVGERGIIHTHSEKVANYIRERIADPRLTFNKDYKSADAMLAAHAAKSDSFIVASGLREGLDLYGDLSRVQIICKVPYPSMGDKRIKRRMNMGDDWYTYYTTLMFVQSIGRSVRSETDKATTYVLDSAFDSFYKRAKYFIPKYVREAIIWR